MTDETAGVHAMWCIVLVGGGEEGWPKIDAVYGPFSDEEKAIAYQKRKRLGVSALLKMRTGPDAAAIAAPSPAEAAQEKADMKMLAYVRVEAVEVAGQSRHRLRLSNIDNIAIAAARGTIEIVVQAGNSLEVGRWYWLYADPSHPEPDAG